MDKLEGSKETGTFTISSGRNVQGEISFRGRKTSLHLYDNDDFDLHQIVEAGIKGVLHNGTKVTLIRCIPTHITHGSKSTSAHYSADFFPHFVVYGDAHVDAAGKTVTAAHFVIDDATTLFYDFDAFGALTNPSPLIDQIVNAESAARGRKITSGSAPQVLYFTGKREIFSVETIIGSVAASHRPGFSVGGPGGVSLKNRIVLTIAFKEPVQFETCIHGVLSILRYCAILIGRPQNLLRFTLTVREDDANGFVSVYWSSPPKRKRSADGPRPHPAEVLIDAVRDPEEFCRVLDNWLKREQHWHDARDRFFNCFAQQNRFDIDRLIASANMFDILPSSAVPDRVMLSAELETARIDARKMFKLLPKSLERDIILGALGRLDQSTLKHKVRFRAQRLFDVLADQLPELNLVIDEAVNCRNRYVHGSESKIDYRQDSQIVPFFTNTLEFVFAVSDLLKAGWDIRKWWAKSTTMAHPFGEYRAFYADHLRHLKMLLRRSEEPQAP